MAKCWALEESAVPVNSNRESICLYIQELYFIANLVLKYFYTSLNTAKLKKITLRSYFVSIFFNSFFFFNLSLYLHQQYPNGNPDDFADATDNAHEDAKGGGEAQCCDGNHEATLLHSELHGQEPEEVGQESGQ